MSNPPEPPEDPTNIEEWLWRLRRYEKDIYVRDKTPDGSFDAIALSELPPERWAFHVAKWLTDGAIPVRVKEDAG